MFNDCVNYRNQNEYRNAIDYFTMCLKDIQENPEMYQNGAYLNTQVAIKALSKCCCEEV